jgi:hypothetical protein
VAAGRFFKLVACVGTQAVENAQRLAAILRETAPAVRVIDPPAAAQQPSLFGDDDTA